MKLIRNFNNNRGFSLIELLIVCGMIGLVMAALFTLYQAHQKTASSQEDVVEVQQNLRTGMDSISKDIKMAGFLAPLDSTPNPLSAASPTDITINTASESGYYARITATTAGGTPFAVESADGFDNGDSVRIIRPQNGSEPIPGIMTVTGTPGPLSFPIAAAVSVYRNGDIIARTTAGALNPNTVRYCLGPDIPTDCGAAVTTCPDGQLCLMRVRTNGLGTTADVVANSINLGLQFSYILDNNLETSTPTAADMSTIRAVRVTITGQTDTNTALSEWRGAAKTRQMASIIRIRNRRL